MTLMKVVLCAAIVFLIVVHPAQLSLPLHRLTSDIFGSGPTERQVPTLVATAPPPTASTTAPSSAGGSSGLKPDPGQLYGSLFLVLLGIGLLFLLEWRRGSLKR